MILATAMLWTLASCSNMLTPELVAELAKDSASFCAHGDVRGGAGGIIGGATGGYGQSTLGFCRSNTAEAKVTLGPDGSISIEHGQHLNK